MSIENSNVSEEMLGKLSIEEVAELNSQYSELSEGFDNVINTCNSLLK